MEILAEAATQDVFAPEVRRCLERQYAGKIEDVRDASPTSSTCSCTTATSNVTLADTAFRCIR